jgi:hypothetical protein
MATTLDTRPEAGDRPWFIVGRWLEYEGEGRANLLRIVGIAAFYIVELMNYYGVNLGFFEMPRIRDRPFHLAVTALAVAWTMVGLGVQLCLRRQVFPWTLKYISTGCDVVLLTCVLTVADGPRSPLVVVYFLILALATLRFSLGLVRFATAATMAGYLAVLGYAKWFTARDIQVPRYHEIMVLLALWLTGITLGQVLRRVRALATDYADRRAAAAGRVPAMEPGPSPGL